jgi:hypothetical protein
MNIYRFHSNPEFLDGYKERWTKIPQFAQIAFQNSIKSGGKRFPEEEIAIAKNTHYAYEYAKYIIRNRFPEGEAAIAKNAKYAYLYAEDVIKGRFPEGETAIAKDTHYAYFYSVNIIKQRFPEGEAAIANSQWKSAYEKRFNVKL